MSLLPPKSIFPAKNSHFPPFNFILRQTASKIDAVVKGVTLAIGDPCLKLIPPGSI
jgi:hypothetical protein